MYNISKIILKYFMKEVPKEMDCERGGQVESVDKAADTNDAGSDEASFESPEKPGRSPKRWGPWVSSNAEITTNGELVV